jgi:hypothetical protein
MVRLALSHQTLKRHEAASWAPLTQESARNASYRAGLLLSYSRPLLLPPRFDSDGRVLSRDGRRRRQHFYA